MGGEEASEWSKKNAREKQMLDRRTIEETKVMHKTLKKVAEEKKLKKIKSKM